MRFLPAIIIACAIVLAPVIWLLGQAILSSNRGYDGPGIDSGARIEIEIVRQQLEALQGRMQSLETELAKVEAGSQRFSSTDNPSAASAGIARDGPNAIIDAYAQVVLIANRRNVNKSLSVATPNFLQDLLGRPRDVLSDKCESMTNAKLSEMLVLEDVGPIRVRMLQPAVNSLLRVFETVRATDPDLYDRISTAGSLCVRRIRGTTDRLSTHAFGLSLDLNIDGKLDTLGDGKTQLGLTILADFFHTEGWIWGAAFTREDSMHFEVARETLERWRSEGLI